MALSDLQQAWLDAYLGDANFNATEAARRAGYKANSDNVFRAIGHQNRHHEEIAAEIDRRLNENAMSADEVLHHLAEQARADFGAIMEVVEVFADNGERVPDDYEPSPENPRPMRSVLAFDWHKVKEQGALVKSISFTQSGMPRVEFYDKQAALQMIGKAHGLFKDVHTGPDGGPIPISVVKMPLDDL